ncbi:MAG: AAA family ATPase [Candidatus Binataceae bacterium]
MLNSVAAGIAKAVQRASQLHCEIGSSAFVVITAPLGAGLTVTIYQAVSIHGWLLVEIPADPNARSFANSLYRAAFATDCVLFGSSHTIDAAIRELRKLRQGGLSGPLLVHNADRVTPKILDQLLDIGDLTGFPIVLCGSRRLRQLIMSAPPGSLLEKAKSRIVLDVDLPGPSLQDALLLAEELATIQIGADLVEYLF